LQIVGNAAEVKTKRPVGFWKRAGAPGIFRKKQKYRMFYEGREAKSENGTGADS